MPAQNILWLFMVLLLIVAFLYSSVGHGGASGYLALMALFSFSPDVMKSSALILNILVSLISFWQFYKGGYFRWRLFLPFSIASVPAAFLGSYIVLDSVIYKRILGVLLIFPILRILGFFGKDTEASREVQWSWGILIGAIVGLLSGMIGIGGGIILSPIIILMHWGNLKQTAAVSALFIFVNSISGLIGILIKGIHIDSHIFLWIPVAVIGGMAGAYLARKKYSNQVLKYSLALVLIMACVKLITVVAK